MSAVNTNAEPGNPPRTPKTGGLAPVAGGAASPPRKMTRRRAIGLTLLGGAAAVGGYYGLRSRIPIAIIGCGGRGTDLAQHLKWLNYAFNPCVDIRAVCDAYLLRANSLAGLHASSAKVYQDYRDVLQRKDIEAVVIATTDHTHAHIAIDAMRSGKAVYCEKPVCVSVAEARKLQEVAKQTGVIFQVGTQQRSYQYFRTACELILDGRLGKLQNVDITLGAEPAEKLTTPRVDQPSDMNWELYCGPAPLSEFNWERLWQWHCYPEYCIGQMGAWGSHQLDILHWVMGIKGGGPHRVVGKGESPEGQNPSSYHVTMSYPEDLTVVLRSVGKGEHSGILFEGDKGRIFVNRAKLTGLPVEQLSQNPLPSKSPLNYPSWAGRYGKTSVIYHLLNFLEAVRGQSQPISGIEQSCDVACALQMARASIEVDHAIECDPVLKTFKGSPEVQALLDRPRRAPWTI
jgi:myo-inositol 2-dehydrogenase / D-chiro-inositol 1-dehydrogenase